MTIFTAGKRPLSVEEAWKKWKHMDTLFTDENWVGGTPTMEALADLWSAVRTTYVASITLSKPSMAQEHVEDYVAELDKLVRHLVNEHGDMVRAEALIAIAAPAEAITVMRQLNVRLENLQRSYNISTTQQVTLSAENTTLRLDLDHHRDIVGEMQAEINRLTVERDRARNAQARVEGQSNQGYTVIGKLNKTAKELRIELAVRTAERAQAGKALAFSEANAQILKDEIAKLKLEAPHPFSKLADLERHVGVAAVACHTALTQHHMGISPFSSVTRANEVFEECLDRLHDEIRKINRKENKYVHPNQP